MLHSYTKIFVHVVWATKNRERILTKEVRPLVQKHIVQYAKANSVALEVLNVQMEHVHALINLLSDQKVENIVRLLKGESSHWINDGNVIPQKFAWQRGYGAFSVSPSHYERVKLYIENQEEHHRRRTFVEEYGGILRKYGFSLVETPARQSRSGGDESVQS